MSATIPRKGIDVAEAKARKAYVFLTTNIKEAKKAKAAVEVKVECIIASDAMNKAGSKKSIAVVNKVATSDYANPKI